ncbi:hypothetical protein NZ698_14375 [Chryseobacterium sp. PBS4-4]|uniref:Uncharacterized protein n=1 Tax=Chryseobacterium edaphi TaxID=2976532 RepID=A0ABT2W8U7_9FLAO|nr:hypothetical protein [Chryseobacterium edaphi]MCU7618383.1 hypothetical protein [Chryseobacterium edaphi]
MKRFTNLLTVSILFFFGGSQLKSQSQNAQKTSVQSENQISYLFFKINKNGSGLEKISLVENKIVKGKMKSKPVFNEDEVKNGDLLITLSNGRGKEIIRQSIEDPLNPQLESFGDKIERRQLKLNESEFSVRFPYSAEIKSVKIEKITDSKKQLLFTQNF